MPSAISELDQKGKLNAITQLNDYYNMQFPLVFVFLLTGYSISQLSLEKPLTAVDGRLTATLSCTM